ncbi:MAG: radical SAM family heme chaperone HemW [Armatimonadetes bacterium]|nr:radical SAM family heme chaperone HemW [Armatimonadota bacterium]
MRKCLYCDFASAPARLSIRKAYMSALVREVERSPYRGVQADSIFFGGGTPSVIASDDLIRVLDAVGRAFTVAPDAEITIECNPGDDQSDRWRKQSMSAFLQSLHSAGFNRLSLGVQSFDDSLLRALGRIHNADSARRTYGEAREAGFSNINIDLMFALPGQTRKQWSNTLRTAVALAPEHLSAYSLIVEEGTPFGRLETAGDFPRPSQDTEAAMYTDAVAILDSNGYARYEVSAFARKGFHCRHNLHYWNYDHYLGFGASATSQAGYLRWTNTADPKEYTRRIDIQESPQGSCEDLNSSTRMTETMMMGLRLADGVNRRRFADWYGVDPVECYNSEIAVPVDNGLLEVTESAVRMTPRGFLLGNEVWESFV